MRKFWMSDRVLRRRAASARGHESRKRRTPDTVSVGLWGIEEAGTKVLLYEAEIDSIAPGATWSRCAVLSDCVCGFRIGHR